MYPQKHCVCLACFKEYLPYLIYKFVKHNNLIYLQLWNTYRKANKSTEMQFLERNKKNFKISERLLEIISEKSALKIILIEYTNAGQINL